jgi:hypothetical protein
MSQLRAWPLDIPPSVGERRDSSAGKDRVHISPSCHLRGHLRFKSTIADLLLLSGLAMREPRYTLTMLLLTAIPGYDYET